MWGVMAAMFVLTTGTLLAVVHFGVHRPLIPAAAPWGFAAGLVLALPALLARRHTPAARPGRPAHADVTRMVTACSLAELPALAGVAYYLLGREPRGAAVLVVISVLLLWRLHPRRSR